MLVPTKKRKPRDILLLLCGLISKGVKFYLMEAILQVVFIMGMSILLLSISPYPFVVDTSKEMYQKWNKYWKDDNVFLAIACVLDPRCKLDVVQYYFQMMYLDEYTSFMVNLKECLNHLFKDYLKAHSKIVQNQAGSSYGQQR
jgi:Domain of unknown function (DUF4413)